MATSELASPRAPLSGQTGARSLHALAAAAPCPQRSASPCWPRSCIPRSPAEQSRGPRTRASSYRGWAGGAGHAGLYLAGNHALARSQDDTDRGRSAARVCRLERAERGVEHQPADWTEVNRVLTYALVVGLGVLSRPRMTGRWTWSRAASGWLAWWWRCTPWVRSCFPGCIRRGCSTSTRAGRLLDWRIRWATGTRWLCSWSWRCRPHSDLAVDRTRTATVRLAAACAVALMVITVPLTYSRGGLIALSGGIGGGDRTRSPSGCAR